MSENELTQTEIRKILSLKDGEETLSDSGETWTLFRNYVGDLDAGGSDEWEYKVSPKGKEGDYDTDCYWVLRDEVKEWKNKNESS